MKEGVLKRDGRGISMCHVRINFLVNSNRTGQHSVALRLRLFKNIP